MKRGQPLRRRTPLRSTVRLPQHHAWVTEHPSACEGRVTT